MSFVRVTAEILQRGVFTDRAIRSALDNQMRNHQGITKKELAVLASKLRKEFGVSRATTGGNNNGGSNGSSSLNGSLSETNLKDLLYRPHQARQRRTKPKVEVSLAKQLPEREGEGDLSEQELSNILYEVDLDESVVEEVLRSFKRVGRTEEEEKSKRRGKTARRRSEEEEEAGEFEGQLRIFDAMNISNLNISFNATAGKGNTKEKKSEQRALLIKSFARKENDDGDLQGAADRKKRPQRPGSSVNHLRSSSQKAQQQQQQQQHHHHRRQAGNAGRQDSSSSNPDNAGQQQQQQRQQLHHQQRQQQSRAASARQRPHQRSAAQSKGADAGRKPPSASGKRKKKAQQQQLPETPLHSSDTPRSSSLYHPEESEEEKKAAEAAAAVEENNKATADEVGDSEISEDRNGGEAGEEEEEVEYASEFEEDVEEEIDDE